MQYSTSLKFFSVQYDLKFFSSTVQYSILVKIFTSMIPVQYKIQNNIQKTFHVSSSIQAPFQVHNPALLGQKDMSSFIYEKPMCKKYNV